MDEDLSEYGDIGDLYDRYGDSAKPDHPDYPKFLAELVRFAEAGHAEAAQTLGDELSTPGPHYKPDEAYKWYHIGLSQQGYTVGWDDQNHSPPYYCGPVGDFRNESIVGDLVVELGWERVRQLDRAAAQWLIDHGQSNATNT